MKQVFLAAALVLFFNPAFAEDSTEKKLIQKDLEISNKIDSVATDIDTALAGEKNTEKANRTTLTIRNQVNWAEGGVWQYMPALDLRLDLPSLQEKLKIMFTTYETDQESRGINQNRLRTTALDQNYGAGVSFLQKLGNVNAEFQPRVEIRNGLQLSHILKLTSTAKGSFFVFHPEAQFFARTDTGVGQYVGLDNDVPIYKSLLLTVINEEQYQDRDNIFSTNNGIRFSFDYNDFMSQTISYIFESSSRPNYHLDRYTVALGFTHKLYKNILHYTLTPYLAFIRDLDFRGSPGILMELDIIF